MTYLLFKRSNMVAMSLQYASADSFHPKIVPKGSFSETRTEPQTSAVALKANSFECLMLKPTFESMYRPRCQI